MDGEEIIRLAKEGDIARIEELLRQVHGVHAGLRPDLFIAGMQKYDKAQLSDIIEDKMRPSLSMKKTGGQRGMRSVAYCAKLRPQRLKSLLFI